MTFEEYKRSSEFDKESALSNMSNEKKTNFLKAQKYRNSNREKIAAYKKNYYAKHRAELLEKKKRYRESHKQEISEYMRTYYQVHKSECDARNKLYRESHKQQMREYYKKQKRKVRN